MKNKILAVIAVLSGLTYIIADTAADSFPFAFAFKTFPIWFLCYLIFTNVKTAEGRLVGIGILFGSGGDVALALGHFIPGLVSFLIGHLFFIAAWLKRFQFKTDRAVMSAVVLIAAVILGVWLTPSLGEFAVPVYAYVGVISIMSVFAFLRSRPSLIVPLGTVLFIISDAIIAVNKFHSPVPFAGIWIMITYYAAQSMIALGFIKEQD